MGINRVNVPIGYTDRRMSEYLARFTGAEQEIIFQYGMNTRDYLVEDLTAR